MLHRHVLIAHDISPVCRMIAEMLALEAEDRGIADLRVTSTSRAAAVYEHLRTSQEPLLVLVGWWLDGGIWLDVLRAVAEDATLQHHEYIELGWFPPTQAGEREELSRRLGVKHLPLPCGPNELLDVIDAPVLRRQQQAEREAQA